MQGIQIGQLLVEQGVLTERQVQHILNVQRTVNRPFGDLAEGLFGVDPKAVEDAWVEQYIRIAGVVDLEEIEIDQDCLRKLNRRQAWQLRMIPTNRLDDQLNIATTADALVRAVNFSARRFDEPVFMLIAEREQLREFLMRHYPIPSFLAEYADTRR
ncbi:MAG TPA: hypothetical protein PKB10_13630 [Tepidisphaeraceae bacterium]|nr:hypothetical protein [Tepidisphaeraceae bacterium]